MPRSEALERLEDSDECDFESRQLLAEIGTVERNSQLGRQADFQAMRTALSRSHRQRQLRRQLKVAT